MDDSLDRAALRREVRHETRRALHRPRLGRCCGCCSFIAVTVAVVALAIGGVVTQTGVIHVPLISNWWYVAPEPIRLVTAEPLPTQWPTTGVVRLSEQQATAGLLQIIDQQSWDGVKIGQAQIVIVPEGLELFLHVDQPFSGVIAMMVQPRIVDGLPTFEPVALRLGNLALPVEISRRLLAPVNNQLAASSQDLPWQLEKITLADGFITLLMGNK